MNQTAAEKQNVKSAKEFRVDYGEIDQNESRHPTRVIKKNNSEKLESPEYEQESKALQWALKRLASWDLPGKEHVAEYFRNMHRRNFRPKTYISNLICAI